MQRRQPHLWLALGAALLLAAVGRWVLSQSSPSVGSITSASTAEGDGAVAGSQSPASNADGSPGLADPSSQVPPQAPPPPAPSDPLAAVRPVAIATPASVRIPALGIDAAVVDVGVEPDGAMEIPADVATVGWYRHGPVPGAAGSTVIAGHVDSRTQGRGAFFDLATLGVGDRIDVVLTDGSVVTHEVRGRDTIEKSTIGLDEVFDREGPARLTLITCGGPFDYGTGHYVANVVVVAVPVDA